MTSPAVSQLPVLLVDDEASLLCSASLLLLSDTPHRPEAFAEIVTQNKTMQSLFRYVEAIARSPQPVLITGETGTGKELMARAAHRFAAPRGDFVAINVAGLDDQVFSDTLFGHTRGAFTGADRPRDGLITRAEEGTLFLDEIGDLAAVSQVKLLRLLQEGTYYPLGADSARQSRARLMVATNRDVVQDVHAGTFRKDLYYAGWRAVGRPGTARAESMGCSTSPYLARGRRRPDCRRPAAGRRQSGRGRWPAGVVAPGIE
jgi:transcriptional regulator with GAF, ATPase, and Fis domain